MDKVRSFYDSIKLGVHNFFSIFKDDNEYNEKTIIGFLSFLVLSAFAIADLISKGPLAMNDNIFDGFLWMTLGALGIAGIDKLGKNRKNDNKPESTTDKNKRVL